ncbi:MAG: DNA-3-methyladenine glycosylase [Thermoleophilia bacterium]
MVTLAPPAPGTVLGAGFFARPVAEVAPDLVGCTLLVDGVGGTIVETERYQEDDPASHSFRGPRGRARVMFGPPGVLYVYRSYGLHWCANLVCEPEGSGAAVLVRAVAPEHGMERMRERRGAVADRLLCAGPGRLTEALGIDGAMDGAPATGPGAVAEVRARTGPAEVVAGPRVGISKAVERPWRFCLAGSPHLSRPLPRAA